MKQILGILAIVVAVCSLSFCEPEPINTSVEKDKKIIVEEKEQPNKPTHQEVPTSMF